MIEQLDDLPAYALGFRASGEVTEDDYRRVLIPAVESVLEKRKRVRLLYVFDESFDGYSAGAAWEDAKVGLTHFTHSDRVAMVTSSDWIRRAIKAFGFVMPGEVLVFNHGGLDRAREWISATPSKGALSFEFLDEQGVLILHPEGELEAEDFERVSEEIDPHIEKTGNLTGLVIVAEHALQFETISAMPGSVLPPLRTRPGSGR